MAGWWPWCCCTGGCDFLDVFDTVESGYTDSTFSGIGTLPNFQVGSNTLTCHTTMTDPIDDGSRTQAITRPALNGLLVSVQANVFDSTTYDPTGTGTPGYQTTGLTIGKASFAERIVFHRRQKLGDHLLQFRATGAGSNTNRIISGVTHAFPMKLEVEDVSAGAGTYDIRCSVGGTVVYTESSVALTLPSTLDMGVICTDGGSWKSLCINWT